ncbi:uncharacterized protein HMPREF1541_10157 [Cyphellophora europaea CBS 101466]|uniref:Uncharacterized protein n=1 Tax=Cyphellophora europaea (strain CBS 101466) TaxID=1220924 RepID=W2S735_CYPE1|nr:uncharacterized protein HMPREF1541_10157 [Cyphellophora europaea CBS 101466]ETN44487.1 hypothetical protein HMPREF1541_10157 [Cyphellophora europaea CBS 101466]
MSNYHATPPTAYSAMRAQNPWAPGAVARMPWLPLAGFAVSLVGLIASAAILVYSNGKPIADWAFQPPTYLAIATVITNVCLFYVLKEGANIAWWHAASQSTTIGDLHRHWLYGSSFQDAILSGRRIDLVALACIIATLAQINSPLLQRASRAVDEGVRAPLPIDIRLAITLPYDYFTGYVSGRAYDVSIYSPQFGDVVQSFNNNATIQMPKTGCKGTCSATVEGLGFALNCSSYTVPYDLNPQIFDNGSVQTGADSSVDGIDAFETHFRWSTNAPSNLTIGTVYKPTLECSGALQVQNCSLHTATVRYKVVVDGNASTIALDPHTSIFDDNVLESIDLPGRSVQGPTSMGGFWLALQNKYASTTHVRFAGAVGYEIASTGNLATQYAVVNGTRSTNSNTAIGSSCDLYFRDPITELLAGARDLMFRLGVAAINSTMPSQSVMAESSEKRAVFRTNYAYLGGAVGITIVALLLAAALFKGYSTLGRPMTMSPVELAKAFDAPLLKGADSNAEMKALIELMGTRSVMYGAGTGASGQDTSADEIIMHEPGEWQAQAQKHTFVRSNETWEGDSVGSGAGRLLMGPAHEVRPPRRGEVFGG